jgi:hypothetical protein
MPVSAERQPGAGPEIRYKLRLFERLTGYSQSLLDSGAPAPISRGNRKFESISLQERVTCEPEDQDRRPEGGDQDRQIGASLRVVIPEETRNGDAVPSNLVP